MKKLKYNNSNNVLFVTLSTYSNEILLNSKGHCFICLRELEEGKAKHYHNIKEFAVNYLKMDLTVFLLNVLGEGQVEKIPPRYLKTCDKINLEVLLCGEDEKMLINRGGGEGEDVDCDMQMDAALARVIKTFQSTEISSNKWSSLDHFWKAVASTKRGAGRDDGSTTTTNFLQTVRTQLVELCIARNAVNRLQSKINNVKKKKSTTKENNDPMEIGSEGEEAAKQVNAGGDGGGRVGVVGAESSTGHTTAAVPTTTTTHGRNTTGSTIGKVISSTVGEKGCVIELIELD